MKDIFLKLMFNILKNYINVIIRWLSRFIPDKYFSNLQIHFKLKNCFKSRSISQIYSYILESSKYYFKSITIFQITKFTFEIEIYFSNLQSYNSNRLSLLTSAAIISNLQLYFKSKKLCFTYNFNFQICKILFQVVLYS